MRFYNVRIVGVRYPRGLKGERQIKPITHGLHSPLRVFPLLLGNLVEHNIWNGGVCMVTAAFVFYHIKIFFYLSNIFHDNDNTRCI